MKALDFLSSDKPIKYRLYYAYLYLCIFKSKSFPYRIEFFDNSFWNFSNCDRLFRLSFDKFSHYQQRILSEPFY